MTLIELTPEQAAERLGPVVIERPGPLWDRWLDDGFGNRCPKICQACGYNAMQIVRPGSFRCAYCDE